MSFLHSEILARIRRYCAYQERCHLEVKNKLYELGCATDTVNEIMANLIETNYLNEERFAQAFAGGKFRTKKWGRLKILRELKARKISDYCIRSGLKEIGEDEYAGSLNRLLQQKLKGKISRPEEQKAIQWLMGKGYELDLIREAIRKLRSGDQD